MEVVGVDKRVNSHGNVLTKFVIRRLFEHFHFKALTHIGGELLRLP